MFADTEQKIIDRLVERIPGVTVAPLRELERVPEMRQRAPAIFVIYDGLTAGQAIGTGAVQQITQEWYVVIAAKSARGAGESNAARDQAGAIADQVLSALLGYHLGGGRYLRLSDSPGPEYDAGYCHLPLAFSNAATFKGQP
jgi:hypothetical protein